MGGSGYGEFAIECALKGAIQVYAFEPNPIVYKFLLLNTKSYSQIKTYNTGLWKEDTESLLYFRRTGTASGSIHEIQFSPKSSLGLERTTVQVKLTSIKKVIQNILDSADQICVAVKLDIEGAEHEVIRSLDEDGFFDKIDKLWIEYHYGPQEVVNILKKHFDDIIIEVKDGEMGLIRASRKLF